MSAWQHHATSTMLAKMRMLIKARLRCRISVPKMALSTGPPLLALNSLSSSRQIGQNLDKFCYVGRGLGTGVGEHSGCSSRSRTTTWDHYLESSLHRPLPTTASIDPIKQLSVPSCSTCSCPARMLLSTQSYPRSMYVLTKCALNSIFFLLSFILCLHHYLGILQN